MKKNVGLFTLTLVVIMTLSSIALAAPEDITGHWAEDQITTLVNQNIMSTYSNGQFKPDEPITREEFAEALAKALYLEQMTTTELTDIESTPAKGYIAALVNDGIVTGFPDKTFRPEKTLTRAQVVTMLTRSLGLEEKDNQINMYNFSSYLDMNEEHWANDYIKFASELDILNGYPDGTFRPTEETTRAQAAKMLSIFRSYNKLNGFVADVYPASNKVSITTLDGERMVINLTDTALIGRNNRLVSITDFLKTDKIFVLTNNQNQAPYVKAYGLITKADLVEQVSQLTNYLVSPYEVEALAQGDLDILKPKLLNEVRSRLLDNGLDATEIDALMNQEWNTLQDHGKVRLSEALAVETGLPLDIITAVLDQDWEKVRALAEVEAVQRLVQGVMNTGFFS